MTIPQPARPSWPSVTLILASLPILLILLSIVQTVISEVTTHNGVYDTTYENAAFFGGLYLAIPCGLIDITVGMLARSRGWSPAKLANPAIFVGGMGVLLGMVTWIWYAMVSAFVF